MNHPKKGLKFLQEKGLVGKSPKEVAQFFHEDDRLDKVCAGGGRGCDVCVTYVV